MLKTILVIPLFFITVISCNKENTSQADSICEHPNQLPPFGYNSSTTFTAVNYDKNHCGYFPLSKKNYWVYLDSNFNNNTGVFINTLIDTLRFIETRQSPDGIIWWHPNIFGIVLPFMYSTDTLVYTLGNNWGGKPAVKWFYPIQSDSAIDGSNYTDIVGVSKAYKINSTVTVPAGSFSDCILYQKLVTFPSVLETIFKPGIGVLRFKQYDHATSKLYKISTLLTYHLE